MARDGERHVELTIAKDPDSEFGCARCDTPGSLFTYANQVVLPIKGRVTAIDWCIHKIVAALNAGNIVTTASCCGHRNIPGNIILEDGRVLAIFDDWESAVKVCWPGHLNPDQDPWQAREQCLQPSAVSG